MQYLFKRTSTTEQRRHLQVLRFGHELSPKCIAFERIVFLVLLTIASSGTYNIAHILKCLLVELRTMLAHRQCRPTPKAHLRRVRMRVAVPRCTVVVPEDRVTERNGASWGLEAQLHKVFGDQHASDRDNVGTRLAVALAMTAAVEEDHVAVGGTGVGRRRIVRWVLEIGAPRDLLARLAATFQHGLKTRVQIAFVLRQHLHELWPLLLGVRVAEGLVENLTMTLCACVELLQHGA